MSKTHREWRAPVDSAIISLWHYRIYPFPVQKFPNFAGVGRFRNWHYSVLRDDFNLESDVDVLVTFMPDAQISLFDMAQMSLELQAIFNRPVDILEKDALRNPYRKSEILNSAQVVYTS